MSATLTMNTDSWFFIEPDRRFKNILVSVCAISLLASLAVPWLPVHRDIKPAAVEPPRPVAKLIFEKPEPPKPPVVKKQIQKVKPKPVRKKTPKAPVTAKAKPRPVKKPVVDKQALARKQAASSGLLALQDSLASLRDQKVDTRGATRLSDQGNQASEVKRSLISSRVNKGSGGIRTDNMSRVVGATSLAARTATKVQSSLGQGVPGGRAQRTTTSSGRSIEDIQMVFDRHKGSIFALYQRELRKHPGLQGKLVLRLTIAASGKVTDIALVSSELANQKLEKSLLRRVRQFDFGARDVGTLTLNYPIDFLPT